jgi:Rps23 Pro-64 3,4-dihydroxylase Tpa1-like proline 4-hydroxylase
MAVAATVVKPTLIFDYARWNQELPRNRRTYRDNPPCPHILLEDFVALESALAAAQHFPGPETEAWIQYKHQNENKLGLTKRDMFPLQLALIVDELNSPEFVGWLSELTGIPGLMADHSMEGGGLHQSTRGGFLNIHTDFSMHHYHKTWRRRVNLILYLNPDWQAEWGGAIELWDTQMRNCEAKYLPFLNHALIFTTDEKSLHGFPDPLQCPEDESRKSVALYYYTAEEEGSLRAKSTDYHARPSDGLVKSTLIWLDKVAVDIYSRAKARFGFSDDLASRVLRFFSTRNSRS